MADARPIYRGHVADSRRWDGFRFRDGDIVISTPSKSGTTWMQMLVALLVFDGPEDFPAPLNVLSPWLDMTTRPLEDVIEQLEGQRHRRFIKTHVPLDALPWDERVTYLVVGRDPRDVIVSMWHHVDNIAFDRLRELVVGTVGESYLDSVPTRDVPEDPHERWRFEIDLERGDDHTASHLAWVLHHLQTAWERRQLPNVGLFHFADLGRDLPGEMRRLATLLGIETPPDRIQQLAAEASLEQMRTRAAETAPSGELSVWRDPDRFFRKGGGGEWRDLVTPADEVHYEQRVAELAESDLATWAHHGWGAR